ncbi:MAG: AMP-binding protein [Deltaproteobacteria bacterium]|nr:AMP-binding protein [Deltaproteobacteria bacterium]
MNKLELSDSADRLLGRCLRRQAEKVPNDLFVRWGDERWSYGRVNELANASARGFVELGVARGDTVAFLMDTCPDWIWTTLGLNKLGAIWVPTNTDYKGAWLRESLEDARARVLVADGALLARALEACGGKLPFERVIVRGAVPSEIQARASIVPLEQLTQAPGAEPDDAQLYYGDTAAILWTSGTTGKSKGVMQSHNVWIRAALDGAVNAGLREGEVIYSCLPMYQSAAWVANVYRALVCGVPVAMDARFSVTEFWDRTRHYGATMVFTLGAMHIFLWQQPPRADDRDNPVRVAGMVPMPDKLIGPFKERFGIEEIHQGMGQSEVMGLLSRRPGVAYPENALGDPAEGIDVKLFDEHDREVAAGEPGEICVRPTAPFQIFNGYFNNAEATVSAWRNLWYHTGDLARRDANGSYYFVDRKKDFIRFKGRNISSFQVEAAFAAHPAVQQCAAHAVVSEQLAAEAEMKLCVVLKAGASATPDELCRFVNDTAPYFFVPRYVELMSELPQTPTGRVQKYKLRERGVTPETWDARKAGFEVRR